MNTEVTYLASCRELEMESSERMVWAGGREKFAALVGRER